MINVPYKIILTGDRDCARDFIGAAQSKMRILEEETKLKGLKQYVRRVKLNDSVTVECSINNEIKNIEIYHAPVKPEELMEGEDGFVGRFFARVRRGGLYRENGDLKSYSEVTNYSYYWINFKKSGEELSLKVTPVRAIDVNKKNVQVSSVLSDLSDLPHNMKHSATKSFMLNKSESGDAPTYERLVGTQHALVRDASIIFKPLDSENYDYPWPPAIGLGDPYPLKHPAPPCRFYCNTQNGLMVWYSIKTIPDPYYPLTEPPISYVFGLSLKSQRGECSNVKTFNCYSSEVDAEGFDPLWFYTGTELNPLPIYPEVPFEMLSDVNSIEDNELEVVLPWSYRPIKFKVDLTGPVYATDETDHTYEEVDTCGHWSWTSDGFEQSIAGSFGQVDKSYVTENSSDSGSGPGSTCSGETEAECCPGCGGTNVGNVNNLSWSRTQCIDHRGIDKESWFNINIFSEVESMRSAQISERYIDEYREYTIEWCEFNYSGSPKCTASSGSSNGWRTIKEEMLQKVVDSVDADWSSPNVAFIGTSIDRKHAHNNAFQEPGRLCNWAGNCNDAPTCFDICYFSRPPIFDCGPDVCGGGECFIGYPFPNSAWADTSPGTIVDSYSQSTDGCTWTRTQDAEEYSDSSILQYRVDGEGYFPSANFNRTYYLDDRATDGSDGLLVAVRSARSVTERIAELEAIPEGARTVEEKKELEQLLVLDADNFTEHPIFEVANWSIIYKTENEDFTEITNQLLGALNCNETELVELALI